MHENTPADLVPRMERIEQRLGQIEQALATADRRRRRATTIRILLYVLAGLAYAYYFNSMGSIT